MADSDCVHLPADMRAIAQLDADARIAHIRAERWIQHAAADRLLGDLQDVFDQPPRERMENLLLLGESGMGKTMLIRKFERQNAVDFDKAAGVQRRPVVVMLMPPQPTESEFFNRLLEAIGAPSAGYWAHGNQLRTSAIQLLREVGARVLVIDEINSVLAGTPRQQRLFLQLLRFLSNDLRLALVGVGVPEARHPYCRTRSCAAVSATSSCRSGRRGRICATSSIVWSGACRCGSPRRWIRHGCAPCWLNARAASRSASARPWNAPPWPPSALGVSGSSSRISRHRRSGAAWRLLAVVGVPGHAEPCRSHGYEGGWTATARAAADAR
jgi:hypothetical protein